ncbi:MAG: prepilin-type N-terminal cleavage/methylation domain-containing protein, partial [Firmicutes bacterium]|nr:prepilin-type N-terminal cleavage/methylation domain-containing protein [Bacillota bacterium]
MIKYLFQRDREAGFTLLELLVVLALSGTVLAAIFSFYVLGISNYT